MASKFIIVIDDSELICDLIFNILTEAGYTVSVSPNGTDGLKKLKQKRPDAIILDLELPDVNGLQFCQLIKRDPDLRHIPILMCSARNSAAEKVSGLKVGADDYIAKPFDSAELLARVNALFRHEDLVEERVMQKMAPSKAIPTLAELAAPSAAQRFAKPILARRATNTILGAAKALTSTSLGRALGLAWENLYTPRESFAAAAAMPLAAALSPLGLLLVFRAAGAFLGSGRLADVVLSALATLFAGASEIGLLWALLPAPDRKKSWAELARIGAVAASPLALAALLSIIYAAITNGMVSDFTGSPFLLLGRFAPGSKIAILLGRCDVFDLWAAFLLYLGAARLSREAAGRAAIIGAGGWTLLSLLRIASRLS